MVVCKGTSDLNQCEAAAFCNGSGGWKLCTANQFVIRGGAAAYVSPPAWIASCIRSGGVPHAPSTAPCACVANSTTSIEVAWPCQPGVASTSGHSNIGVRTSPNCRQLGVKGSLKANWKNWRSPKILSAAVCCN